MPTRTLPALLLTICLGACASNQSSKPDPETKAASTFPPIGMVERLDPALDKLIAPGTKIEKLAEGYEWAEGPVWVSRGGGHLLFSDVIKNTVHKFDPKIGKAEPFLSPSGYTGSTPGGGEPGSNGLTLDPQGRLVLCQHGDRRIARLNDDGRTFTTLVDRYQGKRFNSPNDLCYDSKGNLYFTDPPYGLEGKNDDPKKETPFQGVYRRAADGKLTLLTKDIKFPNGIALSPDERILYIAESNPDKPVVHAFDLKPDGTIADQRTFFDASALAAQKLKGNPDGMKVDVN